MNNYSEKKALILIPCCKEKRVNPNIGSSPLQGIEEARGELLELIRLTPNLAQIKENQNGILNSAAFLTPAIKLYCGNFYRIAVQSLSGILSGKFSFIHVLIVSSFYGLAKLDEGLKIYELKMCNRLNNGMKVYQYWLQQKLSRLLRNYIDQYKVTHIWSLLPDSMPAFPYHQVFDSLWRESKNSQTRGYHVRVLAAGSGTGIKRADWLREVLKTNPSYLIEDPMPPNNFVNIPGYTFKYVIC